MPERSSLRNLCTIARLGSGAPIGIPTQSRTESLELAACAVAHGLGAAVYLGLERAQQLAAWDETALAALRDELVIVTGANLRRASQLSAILTALQSRGITALGYKGPALSWQAYGHIGTRLFDDLDVLVAPEDRAAAMRALEAMGYARDLGDARLATALPAVAHEERLLPRAPGLLPVEIHSHVGSWRLAAKLSTVELLSRRVACPLPTGTVPTLSTEDTLITLSVHASKHRWHHIRLACEIAGVIRREPVRWDVLRERATAARLAREVRVALLIASDLCSALLPAEVQAWAGHDRVARLICGDRVASLCEQHPPLGRWQEIRHHLRYRERLLDKVRYFVRNELIEWVEKVPWERWRGTVA